VDSRNVGAPAASRPGDDPVSLRQFLPHAPVLLLAVVVAAAFEQDILSLLPVYGLAHGASESQSSRC
jgi:hypothetical protein